MTQLSAEHYDCPNCGADLNPSLPSGHEVYTVRCEYCGKKIRLKREPAPRRAAAPGQPVFRLRVEPVKSRLKLLIVIFAVVPVIAVGGLILALSVVRSTVERAAGGGGPSYPLRCSGDGQLSLSNETARAPGAIIEASGSCKVTIDNANISSDGVALIASGSATISVSNSNVDGAAGAITSSGGAHVTVSGTSVSSRGTAVLAKGSSQVRLTNSNLSGEVAAYATEGHGAVHLEATTVRGPVPASE